MTNVYLSPGVISIDVPEVDGLDANFVYNFFTQDEAINGDGTAPTSVKTKPRESFNSAVIDEISKIVPRFVVLTFKPIVPMDLSTLGDQSAGDTSNEISSPSRTSNISPLDGSTKLAVTTTTQFVGTAGTIAAVRGVAKIEANLDKIISEEKLSNNQFTGLDLQDNSVEKKLFNLVSGTLAQRINSANIILENKAQASVLEYSKELFKNITDTSVNEEFIVDSLNKLNEFGVKFIDDAKAREQIDDRFDDISRVYSRMKVNRKVIYDVMKTINDDSISLYSDEVADSLPRFKDLQDSTRNSISPGSIQEAEYEPFLTVDPVNVRSSEEGNFQTRVRCIGYVIDRHEVKANGRLRKLDPIILQGNNVATAVDFKVKYGTSYRYGIRAIYQVEFQAQDVDTSDLYVLTVLIASRTSTTNINCNETVNPPPPSDFNVTWDYSLKRPRLTWSFPPNPQRDIKKFQVFRRLAKDIKDESGNFVGRIPIELCPFELIKEFDFNDSDVRFPNSESPNRELVEFSASPQTFFIDDEFEKDTTAIYAVCSVDAHGLSSNYSVQYTISFDKFSNKLVKDIFSPSSAPKPYPNLFMLADLFNGSLTDSGHTRMRIYFDPEYHEISAPPVNLSGRAAAFKKRFIREPIGLLSTSRTNPESDLYNYQIEIINVDLQKRASIGIRIDDIRTGDIAEIGRVNILGKPFSNLKLPTMSPVLKHMLASRQLRTSTDSQASTTTRLSNTDIARRSTTITTLDRSSALGKLFSFKR